MFFSGDIGVTKDISPTPDWEASLKDAFKQDFQLDDLVSAVLAANCVTDKRRGLFGRGAVPMPFQIQLALRIIYLDPNASAKIKEQLASTIIDNYLSTEWAAQALILLQPLSQSTLGRLEKQMVDRDSRIRMSAAETLYTTGKDVTKDLCSMLNDPNPEVRQTALRLLSAQVENGDHRVEQVLIANITGGTGDMGQGAVKVLARLASVGEETLQLMIRFLGKSDETVRKSIISVLHRMGRDHNKVLTLMIRSLGETTEETREALISILHDLAAENGFVEQTLIRFLRHGQPAVRCAIIESVGRITGDSKDTIKCICERLHDSASEVRSAAISKLIKVVKSEDWVVPLLNGVLDSRNHQAQRAAALVLIEAGMINNQSAAIISSWLENTDWELRHCAVYALHSMSDENHVARSLIAKLSDPNESVREAAADILASKLEQSDSSFTMLLELMYDASVEVREGAFRALLSYPDKTDKRLITGLCEKLNDQSSAIRKRAAEFLGDSRTKSSLAVQALLVRLNDDVPEVRLAVISALGNLGLSTHKIIKPLEGIAKNDPDEEVRHSAEMVLRELVCTDESSADMLGQTVSLDNVPALAKAIKGARLFKPSAVAPQRPL